MKKQLIAMEPKLEAQKKYTKNIKSQFKGTVWETGCSSWYLNKHGEVSEFKIYIYFYYTQPKKKIKGLRFMAWYCNKLLVELLSNWTRKEFYRVQINNSVFYTSYVHFV